MSAVPETIPTFQSQPTDVGQRASSSFVSGDPFTLQLLALAERVAKTEVTVLIGGPTGAGKEVLARYIHDNSSRAQGQFLAFNCACLPESMVEDILFGHEKGAFTGAVQRFPGLFEQANGGTLLLDEIGELPQFVQAKLLRVLQEREFTPLGSTKPQKTNFRLLAATNRNLKAEVNVGKFREDLYYRINIFPLQILPLKQRRGDILPLSRALLNKHRTSADAQNFDSSAIDALHAYDWPGNVRELENAIQRALVVADGPMLSSNHLGLDMPIPQDIHFVPNSWDHNSEIGQSERSNATVQSTCDSNSADEFRSSSLAQHTVTHEAELIIATLREAPTKAIAAARLGISERTLRYKLARMRDQRIGAASV